MEYEPIKDFIAVPMRRCPRFRRLAYKLFELGFLRVRHVKRQLRSILRDLPPEVEILDAGFGFGPYSDLVLREKPGARLTGYEINPALVRDCREYFQAEGLADRCRLEVKNLLDMDVVDRYHLAIAVDIMEHIEDDVRVLSNLQRSLKPGGVLFIHTPAQEHDSREVSEHRSFVGEHVRDGYHPEEMMEKLHSAGFRKVVVRFTYGRWGMKSWWLMQGIPLRLLRLSPLAAVILPLYYLFVFPFAHRMMIADLTLDHLEGGGLMVKAWK